MFSLTRRALFKGAGAATAGALVAPLTGAGRASAAPHDPQVLATGLTIPWGVVFLGSDALVGETGTCDVFRVARTGGSVRVGHVEGGVNKLMSMALSPAFATDRRIYAYVRTTFDNRVVYLTWNGTTLSTPVPVFTGIPVGTDHQGGALVFGPDGMLYVGVGDLGTPADAQDTSSLAGKTLRIRRDGSVPADNPFGNAVWTYGHRNVEGMAFHGTTLYATEFGESETDELNIIVRGRNYGWPTVEGGDGAGPVQDPVATWSPTSSCSPAGIGITGGHAYIGALAGTALFQVDLGVANPTPVRHLFGAYGRIRTVAVAPDGALWITTGNNAPIWPRTAEDDRVIRLLPGARTTAPTSVSATVVPPDGARLSWAPPLDYGTSPTTGYLVARDGGSAGGTSWSTTVAASVRTLTFLKLVAGSTYTLSVAAVNAEGTGPVTSVAVTVPITPGDTGVPSAPTGVAAGPASATSATMTWAPPTSIGTSAVTGYRVARDGGSAGTAGWSTTVAATARSHTFLNLTTGSTYTLTVSAINAQGTGPASSVRVVPASVPGRPGIGTAMAGVSGGAITATSAWTPPTSTGGSGITGYVVTALRMSSTGAVLSSTRSSVQPATARTLTMTLATAGSHRFTVAAVNAAGTGAQSARSNQVAAR